MGFKKFIQSCEENDIGFGLWITASLFIIFIRDTIESLVSTHALPLLNAFHLLHVPVFFLSLFLSIILLLHFFTKENILKISKLGLIFFPIIILPVGFDLVTSLFTKTNITYQYVHENVGQVIINFFNPFFKIQSVPYSLRVEILIICLLSFVYVYLKTNKIVRSILSALFTFCVCVLFGALPGMLASGFIKVMDLLFRIFHTFFYGKLIQAKIDERIIVIIELFFGVIVTAIWYRVYDAKKFNIVLKDFRFTRYFSCAILLALGTGLFLAGVNQADPFTAVKILGMFAALFFSLRFSAAINDIFDVDCDRVSNKGRPLATGIITKDEYQRVSLVYLAFALLFAVWVSNACFIISLVFIGIYFLYSVPPFRLKRFFIFSALITGLQALLILIMGQVSLAKSDTTVLFYAPVLWLVFLVFSLSSSIKDLKDAEGDRLCNIYSLPVLFGEARARKIIAGLIFLCYLMAPVFLQPFFYSNKIAIVSVAFAVINYFYIRKEYSREQPVFKLFFLYLILLALLYFRG